MRQDRIAVVPPSRGRRYLHDEDKDKSNTGPDRKMRYFEDQQRAKNRRGVAIDLLAKEYLSQGRTPDDVQVSDIHDRMYGLNSDEERKLHRDVVQRMKEIGSKQANRVSSAVDRVTDRLTKIGYYLPQKAQQIQSLIKRLDRVANQIDLGYRERRSNQVAAVESDLEGAGIQYSVGPAVGSQGNTYFIPKAQDNPRKLQSSLQQIAHKYGANFIESGNNYRFYINN
jgi:hypothetical protein